MVAQLALVAHAGDGLDRQLDLVGVGPVRVCLHPPVHVVGEPIRRLAGAAGAELGGGDGLAGQVAVEVVGGAEGLVDRRGHHRARIGRFLDEEEPVGSGIVLKAGDTPGPHGPDDTHRASRRVMILAMAVRRIVPDLGSTDPAASRQFYADVLGLELVMDLGWVATFAAAEAPSAQITVMAKDATAPEQPDVSIEVDDVDAAYAAVQRLGYEVVHPLTDEAWGVRRFFVREPGGTVLNILSH